MKTCTRCKVEKPLTEYHKNKRNADGHLNVCKVCMKKTKKPAKPRKKSGYTRKVYRCEYCQECFQLVKIGDDLPWDMSGKFCSEECYEACLGGVLEDPPDRLCPVCKRPTFNYFRCSKCLEGRKEIDADLMMGE